MKSLRLASFIILVGPALFGCAGPGAATPAQPVFFPEPPDLPRIQYLTSFTGSKDIEPARSAFEKFVTGEGEKIRRLDKPYGVAIHDGKIYVCDTNATVMVFDLKNRTFAPLQGAIGLGKLRQPINIAIDREGNKFVADPVRGQVAMFDRNDAYVRAYGAPGDWRPVDAAVISDELFVVDSKNAEVVVFNLATGNRMRSLGQKGEAAGRLAIPTNIAVDSEGYLYVSDTGRFQVVKMDRDGNVRKTIGRLGTHPGAFARPRGLAVDRDGKFYAVDAAFDNVQIFTLEGQMLLFFGKGGKKPGDLFLAAGITVDYDNIPYFRNYVDPRFDVEALVLVTSQFGERLVNVYGLGKEKGRTYPTHEDLVREAQEKQKKAEGQPKEQVPDH